MGPALSQEQKKNFRSFANAKETLHKNLFTNNLQLDYYCGCKYDRARRVDLNSCGYGIRKNANRAKRIEWEHVVPASWYGKTGECWYHGGRKNCSRTSKEYQLFESDLHNLRPVIGEVNGDRSNLSYGIASPQTKPYGKCQFKNDFKSNVAEPPDHIKGDMARISLYMFEKYNMLMSPEQKEMFKSWNEQDPVDDKEREINKKIKELQGDENYYIERLQ